MINDENELLLTTINEEEEDLKNADTFGGGPGIKQEEDFDFIETNNVDEEFNRRKEDEAASRNVQSNASVIGGSGLMSGSSLGSSSGLMNLPAISTSNLSLGGFSTRLPSDFSPDSGRHSRGSLVLSETDLAVSSAAVGGPIGSKKPTTTTSILPPAPSTTLESTMLSLPGSFGRLERSPPLLSPSEQILSDFHDLRVSDVGRSSFLSPSTLDNTTSFSNDPLAFNPPPPPPAPPSVVSGSGDNNGRLNQAMTNIINLSNVINESAAAADAAAAAININTSCDNTETIAANLTALAKLSALNDYFPRSLSPPPPPIHDDFSRSFSFDPALRSNSQHKYTYPPFIPRPSQLDDIWNTHRNKAVIPMQIRSKFGQQGPGIGYFSSPHGFCLGLNGEIVVADTHNHRIQVFDDEGALIFHFGVAGKEEGSLWYPRKVAVNLKNGNYVICDRGGERSRMQIFSQYGNFLHRIQIRFIDIVAGLAVTNDGNIVAVDSVTPTIFLISESGSLIKYIECSEFMSEPSDIGVHGNNYYICDFKGHSVVVVHESGQFLRRIGCKEVTRFPNGIDISDAGDVVVGDSHGNQFHVAIYDREGVLLNQFICPHVKVSRCCGLKITKNGYVVTLAKNNHHVLVLDTLYVS